jgi:hypothetical protein
MYKTSTRKVLLCTDREGRIEEFVRVKIWQAEKNPDTKKYRIDTADFIVRNLGTENESLETIKNRFGFEQTKSYYTSYEDYESEKEQLLLMFSTDLTGSELDDYLLLKKLEMSLMLNPIYELTGDEWE